MAEMYTQKGPALSAAFARMAEPKQIDIGQSLNLIDKFSGAVAGTMVKTAALSQAKADGDFFQGQFNPTDARDEAIYTRTYRSRENRKWFEDQAAQLEEAKTNPSHPLAKMSDKEFNVFYQESINTRIKDLATDSETANTQNDFIEFTAEHGPKLQANHAVLRRAVNQEKIINESAKAVSDFFLSKDATKEGVPKFLDSLPGLAVMSTATKLNLLMTSANMAAGQGVRVGLDYMETLLPEHPELAPHINTSAAIYQKKKMEENDQLVFIKLIELDEFADKGLITDGIILNINAHPIFSKSISHEQLIALKNRSDKNRAELEAANSAMSAIKNGGLPNVSEPDLNKYLNGIWHETLDKFGGDFRKAIPEYNKVVGHVGKFGSDFTGAVGRALKSGFETPMNGMPPNDWIASMLLVSSLGGNADMLGLSDDEVLASKVAVRAFETHTSKDGSLAPLNEATQAAYNTFSLFRQKKVEGSLPDYIQDRFKFKQLLDDKLKDKTTIGRLAKTADWLVSLLPGGIYNSADAAITPEISARLYDTAYMLAVNNNYSNVDDLLEVAVGKIKNDYIRIGGKLQRNSKVHVHNIMEVSKHEVPAVMNEFISSGFIKENFPGHNEDELNIDLIGVGADAMFSVSSLKDPNLSNIHVPASQLGTIYKGVLAKRSANTRAEQETDLKAKRQAADLEYKQIRHDFTRSIGAGGSRSEMVPESFKKLYRSLPATEQGQLATAWINAHDKAAMQDMRITMGTAASVVGSLAGGNIYGMGNAYKAIKAGKQANATWEKDVADKRKNLADLFTKLSGPELAKEAQRLSKQTGVSESVVLEGLNNKFGTARVKDMAAVLADPVVQPVLNEFVRGAVTNALITGTEAAMNEAVKKQPDKFKIPQAVTTYVNKQNPIGAGAFDHLRESKFLNSYSTVAVNEGKYGWDTNGAQVFMGVNRKSWPNWSVWKMVDGVIKNNNVYKTTAQKEQALDTMADTHLIRVKVAEFYHKNFYKPLHLDKIKEDSLRTTIMDLAVRGGVDSYNKIIRQAIADLGGNTEINTQPLSAGHISFINKNSAAFYNKFFDRSDEAMERLDVPQAARQAWEPRNERLK